MAKCARKAADNLEAFTLPKLKGSIVRAHDEVELHSSIALSSRVMDRVIAHLAGDPSSRCCCARHEATIANVTSTARLICPHIICANNGSVAFGDKVSLPGPIQ